MSLTDISWSISDNDVILSGSGANDDFTIADYMQVADQNAGILSQVEGMNPYFPQFGVDVNSALGGSPAVLTSLLNIWQQQSLEDSVNGGQGALTAVWKPTGLGTFILDSNYGR